MEVVGRRRRRRRRRTAAAVVVHHVVHVVLRHKREILQEGSRMIQKELASKFAPLDQKVFCWWECSRV